MTYIADRITVDERICNGKPTIRGLAITVKTVLEFLFVGESREEILYQYPDLTNEDLDACLQFANADTVPSEITDELTAEQRQRLEISLRQVWNGDVIPRHGVKRQVDEWSSK